MTDLELKNIGSYGQSHPNSNINYESYIPLDIRSTFENFEYLNDNVCKLNSLRGVIDYELWKEPIKEINISKYTSDMVDTYNNLEQTGGNEPNYYDLYKKNKKLYFSLRQLAMILN